MCNDRTLGDLPPFTARSIPLPEAATDPALLVAAALFCLVTGANDGGALLASGLKLPAPRTGPALVLLCASLIAVPLLVGTSVAATFTEHLVDFAPNSSAHSAVLVGVVTALAVTSALTQAGRPTSLTLATVGGLTGAGLGAGLPVSFGRVGTVLSLGMAAPLVGGVLALGVVRLLRRLPTGGPLVRAHMAGFAVQCAAYAANDGQKMFAVLALGLGTSAARLPVWSFALATALFALGALYGLPRAGRTLGGQLVAVRPVQAVASEVSGSFAVLGSAALGVPVSMTQSVAGGLVGAGVASGAGRVRWQAAARLAAAWLLTLPASVALAAAGGALLR
ncbi:inorganic phosphate transporter [Actinomadura rupiterrae]|uniref:inorganic phosphate transporter n=1 Tax=Actinomadura rupiterrae TaxID=559627 RepID=UPI0020A2A59C|nr:inorganic phosphate transporter [Actinomadura rupiterrae]